MANNTLIGAIRVEASLDGGKFVEGAKKIRNETKKTETDVKRSFSGIGAAIKGGLGGLTAGLSIGALAAASKKALDYAASLKTASAQLGITTKDLQNLRYAAVQSNVAQADFDQGLRNLKNTLGRVAAGAKEPTRALEALRDGLSKEVVGKDPATAFKLISESLAKIPDPAKRAAYELAIFQEVGSKLDPLLARGSAAIDELAAANERLGGVLSDSAIQNADETAKKLEDVKRVLAAQIAGVVAENSKSILGLANALATLTGRIVQFIGSNPQAALAIIGALAGSRFSVPGAIGGGVAGAVAGQGLQDEADQRKLQGNRKLLLHNLSQARSAIAAKRKAGQGVSNAEVARLQSLTAKVNQTFGNVSVPSIASPDIPQFLAGGGGKRGGGRKARQPKDTSLRDNFNFNQDLIRGETDIVRARLGLAHSSEERAALELRLLDLQKKSFENEIAYQVASGDINETQARQLKDQFNIADALERRAIAEDLAADKAHDAAELADNQRDIQLDILERESRLAETAAEKRNVELRILDAMYAQERARLEAVIADQKSSDLAKAEAQQRLNALGQLQSLDRQGVIKSTAGPFESAKADFSDLTDEMESLRVNGIMAAGDALATLATEGFGSFKEAAISAIKSVIAEFIRLQTIKFLFNAIGSAAGAPGAGSSLGGGSFFGAGGGYVGIGTPAFATGGAFTVMGRKGVDQNMLQLNGLPIARVSHGERVSVSNDNARGGGSTTVNFAISGPVSRETMGQIAAKTKLAIASANRKGI